MKLDDIIRMARKAGYFLEPVTESDADCLELFFQVAYAAGAAAERKFWMEQIEVECNETVLAEREACAKVCDDMSNASSLDYVGYGAAKCAAAIRARGNK